MVHFERTTHRLIKMLQNNKNNDNDDVFLVNSIPYLSSHINCFKKGII